MGMHIAGLHLSVSVEGPAKLEVSIRMDSIFPLS